MEESFTIVEGRDLDESTQSQVRHLHDICFPFEADADASMEEFFKHVTFLHEFDECIWFLMWSPWTKQELIGMMASTEYHNSLYCFVLCVHPSYRGQKLSRRIMLEAAQYAYHNRGKIALSGNVERSQPDLIAFYMKMGGVCESTGLSGGDTQPSSLRIVNQFSIQDVEFEISNWSSRMSKGAALKSSKWNPFLLYAACAVLFVVIARQPWTKLHSG